MKSALITAAAFTALAYSSADAEMKLGFNWGNIPLCTTGNPNRLANPAFVLKGFPQGTTKVVFKLTDLDVPNYKHSGGTVKMSASGKVPRGAFKYKSPCPPSGMHTYEWAATGIKGSKTLAVAKAHRNYP
ncbi:MAG: hypothetical protein AAF393_18875 [Pseudomonadota bacterium]